MLVKSEIETDPAPLDPLVGLADDALPAREAPEPVAAGDLPEVAVGASEAKSVKIWVLWYV